MDVAIKCGPAAVAALLPPLQGRGEGTCACRVLQAKGGLEGKDLQAFLTEVAVLHTCRHDCIVEFIGAYLGQVRPHAACLAGPGGCQAGGGCHC